MKFEEEYLDEFEDDNLVRMPQRFKHSAALGNRESGVDRFKNIFSFVIVFLSAIILLTIWWVPYSGMIRWFIIILSLSIVASFIAKTIYDKSCPLMGWRNTNELDLLVGSKLKETSDLVRRSSEGLEMSQALLEERIRDDFVEEMKYERGLSDSEVKELLEDPNRLRNFVGDDVISDFLIHCKDYRETGGDKKLFSNMKINKKSDDDYREWIEIVIGRMENWS